MSFSEYVLNHNVRSKSNTTGAKYGTRNAYPSSVLVFTPGLKWDS